MPRFIGMISQVRFFLVNVYWYFTHLCAPIKKYLHCNNGITEMRKQRKMGHITIVGSFMGDVENSLDILLSKERSDSPTKG